eukprot:CAMPEP_0116830794 /NCGR_PEP_ID=MMETSP0418-20121206/4966_1 /TAXON_ID=1158023 /ORGANISM="Astrosyne radiata, Strain 13vi08-1A" /LENGTH=466 /DNA_ID=CAMNT_0004459947 /DNA_START=14 /DNA_END=1414 /DNA_ORIENTATION=+
MYPDHCGVCHPDSCGMQRLARLGFDESSPRIWKAVSFATLPSIPEEKRIPKDIERYKKHFSKNSTEAPYSIYNPTLLPLPKDLVKSLPNHIIGSTTERPAYLATFRVTMTDVCRLVPFRWWDVNSDMLGVAVLDQNLRLINGLNVVVDINKHVHTPKTFRFEDFRLFALNGKLYLSHKMFLLPIRVTAAPPERKRPKEHVLPNEFGEGLSVRIPKGYPKEVLKIRKLSGGKNFNFFNSMDGDLWIELWPVPHRTAPINLGRAPRLGSVTIVDEVPIQSFFAHEHLLTGDKRYSFDRGSACCIRLEKEHFMDLVSEEEAKALEVFPYLLMGISHAKSQKRLKNMKRYTILSRLYAFSPAEPFPIVALSGLFCIRGPGHDEPIDEPYRQAVLDDLQFQIGEYNYTCPPIHFVSGITEAIDNPNHVVVAYGVNDCIARMVVMHKRDLAMHLFTVMGSVVSEILPEKALI